MNIFVDELPKSCLDCKFCNKENYCCWLMQKDVREYRDDCPLQSLAEHDKQVKKKTIDDLAVSLISSFSKDAEFTVEEICNWLQKVKDQIQGETK